LRANRNSVTQRRRDAKAQRLQGREGEKAAKLRRSRSLGRRINDAKNGVHLSYGYFGFSFYRQGAEHFRRLH
jgi:hypothetical protein